MSDLHTKLEQDVHDLKNETKALKNKLDSWRNEANNMITELKKSLEEEQQAFIEVCQLPCEDCKLNELTENYKSLDGDFIRLASYIKELFMPIESPKAIMIPSLFGTLEEMEENYKALDKLIQDSKIPPISDDLMKRIMNIKSVPMKKPISKPLKIKEIIQNDDLDNLAEALNQPPPPPICVVCGTKMTMDIATLNKIDWYCLECCKKNPMSPLYEEKKRKKDWLRDYFFRH